MRFLTSVFMGHCTAEVLLKMFHDAVQNLHLKKVLQLSMDGPAVNWKFFNLLQEEMKANHNCEILNTGSCGLHTLHNAFKHGEKASEWGIDDLLSSLYYLFRDSPARAEDFLKISKHSKMPKAFCKHRWLENVPTAERALLVWDDVKNYVKFVLEGKVSKPTSKSFSVIQCASKDVLLPVKLNFFLSVSKILQHFLTLFQNDKPLLPFLADSLQKMVVDCLSNFQMIKNEYIPDINSVLKLARFDFTDKKCYSSISKISVGFLGDRIIKDLRFKKVVSDKEIINLKLQSQKFIFTMIIKLLDKSPVKYALVRCMSCLDPKHMVISSSDCYKKMKHILSILVGVNRIPEKDCEEILMQYNNFLNTIVLPNSTYFMKFNHLDKDTRLDTFLQKYFTETHHKKIWHVVQNLLVLSHGQSDVERGFSINKSLEVENLHHKTYIAQRIIIDYLRNYKINIADMEITKKLRLAASGARQKYIAYLSENRDKKTNEEIEKKRKSIFEDIETLQSKKARLQTAINDLQISADNLADEAEKTAEIKFICQSNSFRRTVKEKKIELEDIEAKIKDSLELLKSST